MPTDNISFRAKQNLKKKIAAEIKRRGITQSQFMREAAEKHAAPWHRNVLHKALQCIISIFRYIVKGRR